MFGLLLPSQQVTCNDMSLYVPDFNLLHAYLLYFRFSLCYCAGNDYTLNLNRWYVLSNTIKNLRMFLRDYPVSDLILNRKFYSIPWTTTNLSWTCVQMSKCLIRQDKWRYWAIITVIILKKIWYSLVLVLKKRKIYYSIVNFFCFLSS